MFETIGLPQEATSMWATRVPSFFVKDPDHCLCKVLSPLLKMCQFFGLFPVRHNRNNCQMAHYWLSLPALLNLVWLLTITSLSVILYFRVSSILRSLLFGTDFYTYTIVYLTQACTTSLIFMAGNVNAQDFAEAWNKLHEIVNEMKMSNFKTTKRVVYLLPLYLFQESIGNFIVLLAATSTLRVTSFNKDEEPDSIVTMPVLVMFSGFITNFIPNLLTGTFVIFLWLYSKHFEGINDRLKLMLRRSLEDTAFLAQEGYAVQLGRLRFQHEQLLDAIYYLQRAFGLQMLALFSGTTISFVAGIYGVIVATQGLTPTHISQMAGAFGVASIFAGLRLLLIMLVSQNLMHRANYPARILNSFESEKCGEKLQAQVEKFLQKLGAFPLKITCCDVFQIGTCFIASSSSNIVTYVLVLMQFRLEY